MTASPRRTGPAATTSHQTPKCTRRLPRSSANQPHRPAEMLGVRLRRGAGDQPGRAPRDRRRAARRAARRLDRLGDLAPVREAQREHAAARVPARRDLEQRWRARGQQQLAVRADDQERAVAQRARRPQLERVHRAQPHALDRGDRELADGGRHTAHATVRRCPISRSPAPMGMGWRAPIAAAWGWTYRALRAPERRDRRPIRCEAGAEVGSRLRQESLDARLPAQPSTRVFTCVRVSLLTSMLSTIL